MKISKNLAFFIFLLILPLSPIFQSCSSLPKKSQNYPVPLGSSIDAIDLLPKEIIWTPLEPGFEVLNHKIKKQKISWTCVKIDLDTPNLEIVALPKEQMENYPLNSVKNFAKKENTIVAINSSPFDNVTGSNKPIGINVNQGQRTSEPVVRTDYAALALYKNQEGFYRANFLCPQFLYNESPQSYEYVFSGFFQILMDGQISTFESIRRSRTACATSSKGRYLYLFAVTPDFDLQDNNGLTYEECAFIFQELGCTDAIQFDGGHSTALCIYQKEIQKPLFQRKVPALFGIKKSDSKDNLIE